MDTNCQQTPNYEYNYMISNQEKICQRNIEQILRYFKHDYSIYEEIVAEDIWIHGPASGQETRGIAATKKMNMGYAVAYPDAQYQIHDVFAVGDKVVVRWSVQGKQTGERKGLRIAGGTQDLPPTYREINLDGTHIYRFNEEGKIVETWAAWDRLGEIEQIADISIVAKS